MAKMEGRKTSDDVRGEKAAAKVKRAAHFAKIAAYDAKYKADALARREKGPEAAPAAAEAK
jgi:hypothetical protein